MEYTQKNSKILIGQNTYNGWTRLYQSLGKNKILEDVVNGNFWHKGNILIVYPESNISFLAEIIGCKSNQPRAPIPKPYLSQGEKPREIKTKIQYKVKDIISLSEKPQKIILQQ